MTATLESPSLPMLLEQVEVVRADRVSPSFVRLELGSPALADFGVDGPLHDQRIKLVFPNASGELSSFDGADETWMRTWLDRPVAERGPMRTYTVREVRGHGTDTRLVVDVVLHDDHGDCGPGASWAAAAAPGDRVVLLAPRRGVPFGGIEFAPGEARELLLVGDETAVPAIAGILRGLPADAAGAAYLEVPLSADVQELAAPAGVRVTWLPRDGAARGALLTAAVVEHLGTGAHDLLARVADDDVDPDLWETPVHSSSGEEVAPGSVVCDGPEGRDARLAGLYAWIAGESKVVTGLRRHLVREVGLHRSQVCFMGYWREGVAMRS